VRVKSQSYKKKGKNTIGFLGKGKNTNFPLIFVAAIIWFSHHLADSW